MKIFNRKDTKLKRSDLRRRQTDAERLLWSRLRNKQMNGLKFFRQYGVGGYITDFYCPRIRLAVEIDGGGHYTDEGKAYDLAREEMFAELGIKTIRFSNRDILNELDAVLEKIWVITPLTPSLKKRGNVDRLGAFGISISSTYCQQKFLYTTS